MTSRRFLRGGVAAIAAFMAGALGVILFLTCGNALVVSARVDEPQAIVVLGSHEWERLPVAATLARQYPNALVLLTEPKHLSEHNCHDCAGRVGWLQRAGVAASRVTVLPHKVTNTHDEAKAARAFARQRDIDRLIVVTSAYHGRRALATFRQLFEAGGVRTEIGLMTATSPANPGRWWQHAYDREYVAYEWAGIIYYAFRFRISPGV